MRILKDAITEFADYCSTGLATFGTMPNDDEHLTALMEEIHTLLIVKKYTIEELDKMNEHLDSRQQQYWHAYNVGFLAALQKVEDAIEGKTEELA